MAEEINNDSGNVLDRERAVDTHEVVRLLNVATIKLQQLRSRGQDPKFFRASARQIRYRFGDVLNYHDARTVGGGAK